MNIKEWLRETCACVHPDAFECARRRDGDLDSDDPLYVRRQCECVCHDKDEDEQDDYP